MPKQKSKKPFFSRIQKSHLAIGLLIVAFLGIGALAYTKVWNNPQSDISETDTEISENDEYVNLDPPTDEEKKSTEEHKKNLAENDSPPENSGSSVTPTITFADQSEVRGYVTGVFEEGGTCTATATKSGQTKIATSKGFSDVNKTTCAPIQWSLSGSGWSVTLSYKSSKASGKSEAVMVE